MPTVQNMLPELTDLVGSVDWFDLLKVAFLAAAAVCLLGGVLRLCFGRGSSVVRSVSACVSLVMVYLAGIILYVLIPELRVWLTGLPFIHVTADAFYLYDVVNMSTDALCSGLLQMFILAFLVNLLETLLPHGQKLLNWYGFRLLTVAASLALYCAVSALIRAFAPQLYGEWALYVLLGIWGFIALTGLLKVLLTVILVTINPIIAAIYAFFFSNIFGKQFTKAILTTALSVALLITLYQLGFVSFVFEAFSLLSYGPACLIALLALYLFGKML